MREVYKTYFAIILFCSFGICLNIEDSYMAAVVDYAHIYSKYAKELLMENVNQYLQLIRNASRELAKIIVFPEYGLIDTDTMYDVVYNQKNISNLDEYSTYVPDPELEIVPCKDEKMENFSMHLINISCAAQNHDIYTVVNLLEKAENNETGNLEYYNTNVVFDRLGKVIARYRKIHLSEEPFLKPGNDLVTFETNFGVTFGIFTCFDILFPYPALDILTLPNVTDIIFPTAWYSETPFLQALSIQHGYVKANGINFLGASLQEPSKVDGGSAIFLADGTIAESFITATKQSKIIIQEVPIIKEPTPASMCMNSEEDPNKDNIKRIRWRLKRNVENIQSIDIDNFNTTREDISNYTYEPLNVKGPRTITQVCDKDKQFCCTFDITVNNSVSLESDYSYMLTAFQGLSQYGSNINGGVRTCAVLACLNESDISTCGHKLNTSLTSKRFERIQILTIVDKANDTYYQPATLKHNLQPTSEYTYCEIDINNCTQTKIIMATTAPHELLLTFGIYGRIYSKDEVITIEPPPPEIPKPLNYTLIIMIISFSVVILICSAGLLYKFCMKED